MLQLQWNEQRLRVGRLVFRQGDSPWFGEALNSLAERFQLQLANESAEPHPGDFWVGCQPQRGWDHPDHSSIGWASAAEVALAVGLLQSSEEFAEEELVPTRILRV